MPGQQSGTRAPSREEAARERGTPDADASKIDLRGILPSDLEERLARRIPSIVQEIRLRRGRRFARGPRGRLWVKRVLRESLAQGGVPFSLPMKERRPRRPRILLLVDVSHSVARAAGYFLLICRGLAERFGRTETFFFVDRLVEATGPLRGWKGGPPRGAGFGDLLGTIPGLDPGGASDYGRVFYQALPLLARSTGRETLLVVLGDARSNGRDPLTWAFEDLAGRCRRVVWLNPEAHPLWDTADSVMSSYLPACDVVCEARDLEGLARGVREILRGL
jgi:uncharacterized protein